MKKLLEKVTELGLDETDPKSLEALWPYLDEIIRIACELEAPAHKVSPQVLGGRAVHDLIRDYRTKRAG